MYSLDELLDDRNRPLYEELAGKAQISLSESEDEFWGNDYVGGVISIHCSPTRRPAACFAHELLHAKYELAGMAFPRKYEVKAESLDAAKRLEVVVRELWIYAYNQMMHHKMFPDFIAMGFTASDFLHEADEQVGEAKINEEVLRLKARKRNEFENGIPVRLLVYPFFYLRNPHDSSDASKKLLKDLRNLSGNSFYALNEFLNKFVGDTAPDVSRYLARLFYLCDMKYVGFGLSEDQLIWAKDCHAD